MEKISFTTLAGAKSLLDVTATDYAQDNPVLVTCLGMATDQIIKYIGRDFTISERTDYFTLPRTPGPFKLWTRGAPLIADSFTYKDGDGVALDKSLFGVNSLENGSITYNWGGSVRSGSRVAVTYTAGLAFLDPPEGDLGAGWKVYDAPSDLQNATAIQASHIMNKFLGKKADTGKKAGSTRSERFMLLPEVIQMISSYRAPRYMGV